MSGFVFFSALDMDGSNFLFNEQVDRCFICFTRSSTFERDRGQGFETSSKEWEVFNLETLFERESLVNICWQILFFINVWKKKVVQFLLYIWFFSFPRRHVFFFWSFSALGNMKKEHPKVFEQVISSLKSLKEETFPIKIDEVRTESFFFFHVPTVCFFFPWEGRLRLNCEDLWFWLEIDFNLSS